METVLFFNEHRLDRYNGNDYEFGHSMLFTNLNGMCMAWVVK